MADEILSDIEGSGIYQIRNILTGKRYIGSAVCFRIRWNGHRCMLRKGGHHSRHLQNAWDKNGPEAFLFEVIETCPAADLVEREQKYLDRWRPEYNICKVAGSTLGRRHSPVTKNRIRRKAIGRKLPPRSSEYRKKISSALKGKPKPASVMDALQAGRSAHICTNDERRKISESLRSAYNSGLRSRVKTEEHRNKIGKFYAKLTDDEVRQIRTLRLSGVSGRHLAERFKSNAGTISAICSGKRYRWVS